MDLNTMDLNLTDEKIELLRRAYLAENVELTKDPKLDLIWSSEERVVVLQVLKAQVIKLGKIIRETERSNDVLVQKMQEEYDAYKSMYYDTFLGEDHIW